MATEAALAYSTVTNTFEKLPPQPSISMADGGAFLGGAFYVTQGVAGDNGNDGFWAYTPGS